MLRRQGSQGGSREREEGCGSEREMLLGKGSFLTRTHRLFLSLPSDPRCKLCQAP